MQGPPEQTCPQPFLPLRCLLTAENIFISPSFDFSILRVSGSSPQPGAKCHCLVLMALSVSPPPTRMGQTGHVTAAFYCICHSPQGEGCFLPQILKSYILKEPRLIQETPVSNSGRSRCPFFRSFICTRLIWHVWSLATAIPVPAHVSWPRAHSSTQSQVTAEAPPG